MDLDGVVRVFRLQGIPLVVQFFLTSVAAMLILALQAYLVLVPNTTTSDQPDREIVGQALGEAMEPAVP